MRRWLLIAGVYGACTPSSAEPTVVVERTSPASIEVRAKPTPREDALLIGWDALPPAPTKDGSRRNEQALVLHRRGDYEAALAGFEAALAADPSHAWARYNRACALSRLGRTDEAAAAMRLLLLEDLPRFRRRYLDDEDLAALRSSPDGAALTVLVDRIAAAYDDALSRGTPAFAYRERDGWVDGESVRRPRIPYVDLRVGVYEHASRRFVPMTPSIDGAYSGVLDREKRQAVVAYGELAMKDMWEVQPHDARATVFSLQRFGEVVLEAKHVAPGSEGVLHGFELWLGPDDTLLGAQYDVGYAPQADYWRWTARGRKSLGWTHDDTDRTTPPAAIPFGHPSLHVRELAEAMLPQAHGARVHRGVVSYEGMEGTVALEKGHHDLARIYASPDPMVFVVASNTIRFSTDGGEHHTPTTRERHVIDRVDMHAQTVARLAVGPGYCHVAWAPDGTLFLDTPKGVMRHAPGSTEPSHDVVRGVRFGTPPFPEEGGV